MENPHTPSPSPSRKLELKTGIFLLIVIVAGPLGAVFLREGMRHAHLHRGWNPLILVQLSRIILTTPDVWIGVGTRLVCALAFMCMLSWADYSFVVPAASANYVVAVLMGRLILGESVPIGRWVGSVLICLGVAIISKTPARTTSPGHGEAWKGPEARPQPLQSAR